MTAPITVEDIERYRNYEEASGVSRDAVCDTARASLTQDWREVKSKFLRDLLERFEHEPTVKNALTNYGKFHNLLPRSTAPEQDGRKS